MTTRPMTEDELPGHAFRQWLARHLPRWKAQIKARAGKPRRLTRDPHPELPRERCCICGKPTIHWLMPENAPLCRAADGDCKARYLKNPRVYDPRGLYGEPT